MKKYDKLHFVEYDNEDYKPTDNKYKNYEKYIGGTMSKRFIRLDSSYLKDFWHAKLKKDNSYVTYLDDFIAENMHGKDDIPIKYVSVLLKKQRCLWDFEHTAKDALGSRLANLMGVPTVYNDFTMDSDEYSPEYYVISIDFVKQGQTTDNLEETEDKRTGIDDYSLFSEWENYLQRKLSSIMAIDDIHEKHKSPKYIKRSAEEKQQIIDKFINDFVSHYIFRNMIVDDMDFKPRNITYIRENEDGKTNYILAPANDFEFVCSFRREGLMVENIQKNLEYLCKNYPDVTDTFMQRLKQKIVKNGNIDESKIESIFKKVMKDEDYYKYLKSRLILNLETLISEYDRITEKSNDGISLVD